MLDHWWPRIRSEFILLYKSAEDWVDDRALRLGAGVAYYSLFTLIPVLFLAVTIASIFLDQDLVRDELEQALEVVMGPELAAALSEAITAIRIDSSETILSLISFGVLVFTATLLFVAWKEVVDLIWGIPRERGVRASLRRRLFGLIAVLGSGALLTVVLLADVIAATINNFVSVPVLDALLRFATSFVPVVIGAIFIGILFRHTPDTHLEWKEVWLAAGITMAMLAIGAWGYGRYIENFGFRSVAGVAGSVLLGLVLVYYASLILLYGMEIVKRKHRSIQPGERIDDSTDRSRDA